MDHPTVVAVRRFVTNEVRPSAAALEHADTYPHALVARMRELGLFGALVPTAYGGLGLDVTTYARVIEELCRGWMSLAGVINSHTMAALIVLNEGTDAQREILPQAAAAHRRVKEIKAAHEAGPERRRLLREMARSYLKLIGEAGLTGALFPEAYGGNGRGVVAECIVDEELAAAGHPADTIRSVSLTLGTISILRYGTEAQKKRHIPARLRGEKLAALAITEPQIG